jgi:hypothetical protein
MKLLYFIYVVIIMNSIYANQYYGDVYYNTAKLDNQSYKLVIYFKVKNNYNNPYIGFYLMNSLIKNQNHIKINLFKENQVYNSLFLLNAESGLSTRGYFNILYSKNQLNIESMVDYKIEIVGLKGLPKNISALPQRFFIYDNVHKTLVTLRSNLLQHEYNIDKYRQNDIYKYTPDFKFIHTTNQYIKPSRKINYYTCGKINFKLCYKISNQPEGYILSIDKDIDIYANNKAGFLYANMSYNKIKYNNKFIIKKQLIIDYPRYRYRGLMIDTARHFIAITILFKIIDMMASLKLNTLHLHLADDEGWRIEVVGESKLVNFGAYRSIYSKIPLAVSDDELNGNFSDAIDKNYGGYYSIADIKSLIKYANDKNITIIPEIDMPSHAFAMKYAYQDDLVDKSDTSKYYSIQGYDNNVLPICMYDSNRIFTLRINKIIQGVADIFKNQSTIYANQEEISLGGDEVPEHSWDNSLYCKNHPWSLISNSDKSHLFFRKIVKNNPNIKFSGWQQMIIDDNGNFESVYTISSVQVGHIWNWLPSYNKYTESILTIIDANNYPIVISFADRFYFDIRQGGGFGDRGLYWSNNYIDKEQIESANRQLRQFSYLKNIVGIEASLWSEMVANENILFFMLYPRIFFYANVAW